MLAEGEANLRRKDLVLLTERGLLFGLHTVSENPYRQNFNIANEIEQQPLRENLCYEIKSVIDCKEWQRTDKTEDQEKFDALKRDVAMMIPERTA